MGSGASRFVGNGRLSGRDMIDSDVAPGNEV